MNVYAMHENTAIAPHRPLALQTGNQTIIKLECALVTVVWQDVFPTVLVNIYWLSNPLVLDDITDSSSEQRIWM